MAARWLARLSLGVVLALLGVAAASCDERGAAPAPDDGFACVDGRGSIPREWRCDGDPDCQDGSDEMNCGFDCRTDSGQSIAAVLVCDGVINCVNGADEIDVRLADGGVRCNDFTLCESSGSPIPRSWLCDKQLDCSDGSDEKDCAHGKEVQACDDGEGLALRCDGHVECPDGSDEVGDGCSTFSCDDGRSIPLAWFCDGLPDCAKREDEPDDECLDARFTCESGDVFVPLAWQCDTEVDCADASDEGDCEDRIWVCDEFQSVARNRVCDGLPDCENRTDEDAGKACPESAFYCPIDGTAIPCIYRCDGFTDCAGDETDESGCPEFACDGHPLPAVFVCDGLEACEDGSDEANCPQPEVQALCPPAGERY